MARRKNGLKKQDNIAVRIRKAREGLHISQKELGKSIGVSDKSISSYEQGRSVPPIEKLRKIAKKTKKPLYYFTDEETMTMDLIGKLNLIESELQAVRELLENPKLK